MAREAQSDQTKSPADPRELLAYDAGTLFESADEPALMGPEIRPLDRGYRLAGPALTVACPGGDNLMLHAALAEAVPGEVLVVQCHDPNYGVWGEVLMTSAIARGVAGLVIDGAVRDVEALRAARFPVFCRAVAVRGAAKKRLGLLRQPISCGRILVWPGDVVVADDSGVVVLKPAEVPQVLVKAKQRQTKEAGIMAGLRDKQTTLELLQLGEALVTARAQSQSDAVRNEGQNA